MCFRNNRQLATHQNKNLYTSLKTSSQDFCQKKCHKLASRVSAYVILHISYYLSHCIWQTRYTVSPDTQSHWIPNHDPWKQDPHCPAPHWIKNQGNKTKEETNTVTINDPDQDQELLHCDQRDIQFTSFIKQLNAFISWFFFNGGLSMVFLILVGSY